MSRYLLLVCICIFSLCAHGVSESLRHELALLEAAESNEDQQPQLLDLQFRAASFALMEGERDVARRILADATARMAGLIGDKDFARHEKKALRTLGGREEKKYYLGDPYEQLFAFIYLGILDYQAGEYELARSSFKSALIADEGTRAEGYKSDCYVAFMLEGLTNLALERPDLAGESFNLAVVAYRTRGYMPVIQNAFIDGCQNNYTEKMTAKESARADLMLTWITEYAPGHLTLTMNPVKAIEDSFASAIASLDSPEKDSHAENYLATFRSKDGSDAPVEYLRTTKEYVVSALDTNALETADLETGEFESVMQRVASPSTNLIALTQAGLGPCKTRVGGHGEAIHFKDYPLRLERQALLMRNRDSGQLYYSSSQIKTARGPIRASAGFQARTRGGRDMDLILASQAQLKDNLYAVSDVVDDLGAFGALASLALEVAAFTVHAEADTRGWHELPAELWLTCGSLPSGSYDYKSLGFTQLLDPVEGTETSGTFDIEGSKKVLLLCGSPWRMMR